MSTGTRPTFKELPLDPSHPRKSAWGLYGKDDQLGTLNLLTEEVVKKAAEEIRIGKRFGLDMPLGYLDKPFFGRAKFEQKLINKEPRTVNDDVWTMNSQGSTQWDGLRHFAYQPEKVFYNGTTPKDINAPGATVLGIHHIAAQGVVGRGVLLDLKGYYDRHNIPIEYFTDYRITLAHLLGAAKDQGVEFRKGDILFTHTGFKEFMDGCTPEYLDPRTSGTAVFDSEYCKLIGVDNNDETLEWIWDTRFAAVAGDQPAWETIPSKLNPSMHEIMISGWGCILGELFDLSALNAHCAKEGRWTFFFMSEPCHVVGGVASPPNSIAIV